MSETDLREPEPEARLLSAYRTEAGVADELYMPDGTLRPVWRSFIHHLARLSPEAVATRFARGDRYLRDAGVFYRKYESIGAPERDWPLSHIPVMIHESDWRIISEGLIQRAELLESVVRDIYGENRLVSNGHLPASLIAQNPAWLRPLVGVKPAGGYFLHFIAFEIGRGPDGDWWVLGDRTEAPSGAGFALENRVATARILPNYYAGSDVMRLANFFRAFQASLERMSGRGEGRIAILTPGSMNDAYFEHTFIARYLGFLLAEGEDLTVRHGKVMVRTVDGLKPINVLWRRLDAQTCDPIELDHASALGTPGLADAARQGGVHVINALGSGILETRALLSFLPRICEAMKREPLKLPNIATWWCGGLPERQHVLKNAANMMIGSAYSTRLPFDALDTTVLGSKFEAREGVDLARHLEENGRDLVGQESVTLSTTPVWHAGGLVPRPMVLRVFLARTQHGWQAMPGGYARIGSGPETRAITMQQGGTVADVWVVSDTPVTRSSLLTSASTETRRQESGALPSRAADNLFWLGRYVERAEGNMRLFRAYHARLAEGMSPDSPLPTALRQLIAPGTRSRSSAILAQSFDLPLDAALTCGSRVRDRFSVDGMMALRDLVQTARKLSAQTIPSDETPQKVSVLLRKITGFSGLVHENMYRSTGWRFLSLGMSLERAANMAMILAALAEPDAPDGALDLLLEIGDSIMSHRARYSGAATSSSIVDLLALDDDNPRAILYHLTRARDHVAELPGSSDYGRLGPVPRLALQLHTRLAIETPNTLTPAKLLGLRRGVWRLSDLVAATYMT